MIILFSFNYPNTGSHAKHQGYSFVINRLSSIMKADYCFFFPEITFHPNKYNQVENHSLFNSLLQSVRVTIRQIRLHQEFFFSLYFVCFFSSRQYFVLHYSLHHCDSIKIFLLVWFDCTNFNLLAKKKTFFFPTDKCSLTAILYEKCDSVP